MDYLFWKKANSYIRKLRKKFLALGENRTHDPPCSSSDALTTEPLEALWQAGLKCTERYKCQN